MSPMSTFRRVILWAVATAVLTTGLILGGYLLADHFILAPRTDQLQQLGVNQCRWYVDTSAAWQAISTKLDLDADQQAKVDQMVETANECSAEPEP